MSFPLFKLPPYTILSRPLRAKVRLTVVAIIQLPSIRDSTSPPSSSYIYLKIEFLVYINYTTAYLLYAYLLL